MTINLASKYLPILDEKYVVESKTSILDVNSTLIRKQQMQKLYYC
jgi:hypothetical protein